MKMEYILIKKDKIRKIKDKDENVIVIPSSPLMIIKKSFDNVKVNKINSEDEEILRSNWDGTLLVNDAEFTFSIKEYSKHKLSYLSVYTKVNSISNIESIDEKINKLMKNNYIVITSYDCISEFYCNKIYKKLNNFERKLKELIFDIYTFSYGMNYYDRNFSDELKQKVKQMRDKSISTDEKNIEQLKQSLYELDYNDIMKLLFTPKWLLDDEKDKFNLIEKIDNDNVSSEELKEYIENIRPKSDWDRLFLPQIGEISNIEESIDDLRKLRNRVAHCKFFRKEHYEECLELLKVLNKHINKALKIVMNIDFQKLNAQYASDELHKALGTLQESLSAMSKSISNMMLESFKQMTSNITSPITDMLKRFKENIVLPSISYKDTDYKFRKTNGVKKFQNKKFKKDSKK